MNNDGTFIKLPVTQCMIAIFSACKFSDRFYDIYTGMIDISPVSANCRACSVSGAQNCNPVLDSLYANIQSAGKILTYDTSDGLNNTALPRSQSAGPGMERANVYLAQNNMDISRMKSIAPEKTPSGEQILHALTPFGDLKIQYNPMS
jgi:hypothetical protein